VPAATVEARAIATMVAVKGVMLTNDYLSGPIYELLPRAES